MWAHWFASLPAAGGGGGVKIFARHPENASRTSSDEEKRTTLKSQCGFLKKHILFRGFRTSLFFRVMVKLRFLGGGWVPSVFWGTEGCTG
jgi:hypothetical protein